MPFTFESALKSAIEVTQGGEGGGGGGGGGGVLGGGSANGALWETRLPQWKRKLVGWGSEGRDTRILFYLVRAQPAEVKSKSLKGAGTYMPRRHDRRHTPKEFAMGKLKKEGSRKGDQERGPRTRIHDGNGREQIVMRALKDSPR